MRRKRQTVTLACDTCGAAFQARMRTDGGDFCSQRCALRTGPLFPPMPEREQKRRWRSCREAILEGMERALIEERFGVALYEDVLRSMPASERDSGIRARLSMRGACMRRAGGQASRAE